MSIASIYGGCFATGLAIVLLVVKSNGCLSVRRESGVIGSPSIVRAAPNTFRWQVIGRTGDDGTALTKSSGEITTISLRFMG